jgi:hypothetical protein
MEPRKIQEWLNEAAKAIENAKRYDGNVQIPEATANGFCKMLRKIAAFGILRIEDEKPETEEKWKDNDPTG